MKRNIILMTLAIALLFIQACGGSSGNSENTGDSTQIVTSNTSEEESDDFKLVDKESFLAYVVDDAGMPRTFESAAQNYLFFRKDGSVAGGGADGEGSMWEGTWTYEGKNLVIKINPGFEENGKLFAGSHRIGYFPDDNALIINGVDYIFK